MNAKYLTRIVITITVVYLATMLALGSARGTETHRYTRYRTSTGHVISVRTDCLAAEDSAATLHVRAYDGAEYVRYGCSRKGF